MPAGWGFKLKGVKGFEKALDPRMMSAALRKNLRRANMLNGKLVEAAIRQGIRSSSGLDKNADLTAAIKGDNKPVVGLGPGGGLFAAITSKAIDDFTVFVGVLKTNPAINIAEVVHEGATIPVTSKMRGMFFVLWQASTGALDSSALTGRAAELFERHQDWYPLKKSTTAIIIPGRPYIANVFRDKKLEKQIQNNWRQALQLTMKERAAEGKQ